MMCVVASIVTGIVGFWAGWFTLAVLAIGRDDG